MAQVKLWILALLAAVLVSGCAKKSDPLLGVWGDGDRVIVEFLEPNSVIWVERKTTEVYRHGGPAEPAEIEDARYGVFRRDQQKLTIAWPKTSPVVAIEPTELELTLGPEELKLRDAAGKETALKRVVAKLPDQLVGVWAPGADRPAKPYPGGRAIGASGFVVYLGGTAPTVGNVSNTTEGRSVAGFRKARALGEELTTEELIDPVRSHVPPESPLLFEVSGDKLVLGKKGSGLAYRRVKAPLQLDHQGNLDWVTFAEAP